MWIVRDGSIEAVVDVGLWRDKRFMSVSVRTSPADKKVFQAIMLGLACLSMKATQSAAVSMSFPTSENVTAFQRAVIYTH